VERAVKGLHTLPQELRRWLRSAKQSEVDPRPMGRLQNLLRYSVMECPIPELNLFETAPNARATPLLLSPRLIVDKSFA
jgi:hypothetical protein